ncbi:MAG: flagellar motor switch protein FliN [Deltaproteobacteria bacterium]|nr:flagellar motor switch protein FliN [Deltaproteobacteria bacterium]
MSTEMESSTNKSIDDQWSEAFSEEQTTSQKSAPKTSVPDNSRPASFSSLRAESSGSVGNLDMILDIPVTIAVEIGRSKMIVKDLLQLGQGSVVELEKLAGEPMEILVNGRLIARGEAVVINEKFGVKLTDIVSPTERINKLK